MASDDQDDKSADERKTQSRFPGPGMIVPLLLLAAMAVSYFFLANSAPKRITSDVFIAQLKAKNVEKVELYSRYAIGKFRRAVAASSGASDNAAAPSQESEQQPPASSSKEKADQAQVKASNDLMFQV